MSKHLTKLEKINKARDAKVSPAVSLMNKYKYSKEFSDEEAIYEKELLKRLGEEEE